MWPQQVASLIGADAKEIVFTSGATESNNISLKGVAWFNQSKKKHIITTQTAMIIMAMIIMEHKCVLDSCRFLESTGFKVTYLPVEKSGLLCLNVSLSCFIFTLGNPSWKLETAITPDTSLVSIMTVNNEIGVKQPIKEIAKLHIGYLFEYWSPPWCDAGALCRSKKVFFHTDAAQAVGKIPIDVNDMNIDLLSISGHKIYGPKGIGALYVRRRPRVRLVPLLSGGGQERGLRSGTVPTPLVVGLGTACAIAEEEMESDFKRVQALSDRLFNKITSQLTHVIRNGDLEHSYPGCLNLSFAYVEGESLLMALKDIALSSGSACTSASLEPSYVLRAIGAEEDLAHSSIRFGISRFTTEEEVDYTAEQCIYHVKRLREMSPLWEMVQEGIDIKTIQWSQH
ncbi:NFS1 [Cordylochernes scorpioides]|uniref:cysteine desulfurase n=1 Tax=Cordylochernes scorpioides TaxID=51811 RepID=A0ABY6L584_9ARAC|nr:NFS1 [Cordylochernes scorpioides]